MDSKDNGGPAFPSSNDVSFGGFGTSGHAGMKLRDYFAAKAMAAYIAANPENQDAKLASLAYHTADAMLAERAK